MHMADALVAPVVAGTMYACSTVTAGFSIHKVKMENDYKKIPVMGVMGAFVFATQMINFTIPGTGASGHLSGGILLSAILGPFAGFLTMIAVLLIQCLLFADGGILALGCNIWNMAFYGCFIGVLLLWNYIMRNGLSKKKIMIASIVGSILTLQLGAFSVTIETLASGITELPFRIFAATMLPIHLVIGFVEGLITSAVLCFIYEARPELLWHGTGMDNKRTGKTGKLSLKNTIYVLFFLFIIIGGGLSLIASSNPDGLEWSIQKITGATDTTASGTIYSITEQLQNITAILPDYSLQNTETGIGTSFSGIIGGLVVIAVCVLISYLFRFLRRKRKYEQNQ